MGHKIGYARVSTADQNPRSQLDIPAAEAVSKVYTNHGSVTKADRPQWQAYLADLRPGDTLVIWKIDRLVRNLLDLIGIVTSLGQREVGVRSLTNGIADTTTADGKLVFGMFALMAEYEAALVHEHTQAGLAAARARGRRDGREPKMTPPPLTIYRKIRVDTPAASGTLCREAAVKEEVRRRGSAQRLPNPRQHSPRGRLMLNALQYNMFHCSAGPGFGVVAR
ncbi:recombinase family protein [Nocardia gamkensis]|uniref:recombinase family protein n=1 Tax=Nocardia gamkensis TaxID=352869 RepID=UPI0036EFB9F1